MDSSETLLEGSGDREKGAYLGAIASLATADHEASPEEIEFLSALCEAAKLSADQTSSVLQAARQTGAGDLKECLDVLKGTDLKFSLITDLISFAKSDSNYSEEEQQSVQKIAQYLGVDQQQFSLLDNFAEKTAGNNATPEQVAKPDFLSSLGLKEKMEGAGINGNALLKGLLGVAAPLIIGRMLSGGRRNSGLGGGLLGGRSSGGGLGSLIGMLSGGRGMGGIGGGLLGGLFSGGRSRW